jgi:hypothetical protein
VGHKHLNGVFAENFVKNVEQLLDNEGVIEPEAHVEEVGDELHDIGVGEVDFLVSG